MVTEEYLDRSRLFRRLKSGPHGLLIRLYAARLVKDDLLPHGIWRCLNLVSGLLTWLARSRLKLTDVDERVMERYLTHRARRQSIQPGDRAALKRLLSVMRAANLISPASLRPSAPEDQIFEKFAAYLRQELGWRRSPSSAINRSFVDFCGRFALPEPVISARFGGKTSSVTSSATLGTGVRRPGRRCARHCAHFSGISTTTGRIPLFLPDACLRSGAGSLPACPPICPLPRFRRFSMVVIGRRR